MVAFLLNHFQLLFLQVRIASAIFSLAFSISTGIVKKLLKTTRNEKEKDNKIAMLATSQFNSIESKIFEALKNYEISHEDFTTIINEERNYRELKESFTMMKTQGSNNKEVKSIDID